jgi:Protein of unknown function (DUF2442)
MFLHITQARYVEEYKIEVSFNNGKQGIADLSDALKGGIFKPLENQSFFSRFFVDNELETLVWPNGADLAPEYIYFQTFKHVPELQSQFKEWGYITTENSLL